MNAPAFGLVLVAAAALAGEPPVALDAPSPGLDDSATLSQGERGIALAGKRPVAPQPVTPDPQPAGSLEVSAQLWAVIARYRLAATADEVRVTLAQPSGRSDTHSLVVRCIPGPAGLARLELADIVLVATSGRLTAVHREDPTTYTQVEGPDPGVTPAVLLRELLPPLPIPQLSLAFDPGDVDWCPLVRELKWESAERTEHDGERGVRLTGRSAAGPASLDLVAGRVRRFDAVIDGESGLRLIVESRPVEPGDPLEWGIETEARRPVDDLALLRPLGEPLAAGSRWPPVQLTPAGSLAPLEWPGDPSESLGARSALRAAWLFRAEAPPAQAEEMARRALGALAELRREILRGRIDGRFDKRLALREVVGIALVEQEGDTFERVEDQLAAWRRAATAWPGGGDAPELYWTAAEPRLLDRIAPGAPSAIVLLDGRGEILATVPVRAGSDAAETSGILAGALPPAR